LHLKGEICKKVYAAVHIDDKYAVLENGKGRKFKYQLAGGGVEDGETNQQAIIREIAEELNINAKLIKSLGNITYESKWKYKEKEFSIINEAEIFLLEFVSYLSNSKLGLVGEFTDKVKVNYVSEEEMRLNVYEFASGGIKFEP